MPEVRRREQVGRGGLRPVQYQIPVQVPPLPVCGNRRRPIVQQVRAADELAAPRIRAFRRKGRTARRAQAGQPAFVAPAAGWVDPGPDRSGGRDLLGKNARGGASASCMG